MALAQQSVRLQGKFLYSGILAGIFLFTYFGARESAFKPEEAALGFKTVVARASFQGRLIADTINFPELKQSFRAFRDEGNRLALWLGASQLHAIHRARPGDRLGVFDANRLAAESGAPLIYLQISSPNAGFHDFLAFYLVFREAGLIPNWLLVAVTYDDLREQKVRDEILFALPEATDDLLKLGGEGVRHLYDQRLHRLEEEDEKTGPVPRPSIRATPQVRVEKFLISSLEKHWGSYRSHGLLSARIELVVRSFLARAVEGMSWIKRSARRILGMATVKQRAPEIEVRGISEYWKAWNMSALKSLVRLAQADGVKMVLYRAPHRHDLKGFHYSRAESDAFFQNLSDLGRGEGLFVADFETLVPPHYWPASGDAFHFEGEGHRRLAAAVHALMKQLIQDTQGDAF